MIVLTNQTSRGPPPSYRMQIVLYPVKYLKASHTSSYPSVEFLEFLASVTSL